MADQNTTRLTGIVGRLFDKTGGLIITADQTVYSFHGHEVWGKLPPLHAVVSFDPRPPRQSGKRPRAMNVKIEALPGQQEEVA